MKRVKFFCNLTSLQDVSLFTHVSDALMVTIDGYNAPVSKGGYLFLTCQTAFSQTRYTWLKQSEDGQFIVLSNNALLSLNKLMAADSGVYRCRAETSFAVGEKDVHVVVESVLSTAGIKMSEYTNINGKGI